MNENVLSISMQISQNSVVQLEYTATLEGVIVTQTVKPKLILIGRERDLLPSLESLLLGKTAPLEFNASTENAYGTRDEQKIITVLKSDLPLENPQVGAKFSATAADGSTLEARVIAVDGERVTVDMNHPRAGKTLKYVIKILAVRNADAHELEHGHAHGAGGVVHLH